MQDGSIDVRLTEGIPEQIGYDEPFCLYVHDGEKDDRMIENPKLRENTECHSGYRPHPGDTERRVRITPPIASPKEEYDPSNDRRPRQQDSS